MNQLTTTNRYFTVETSVMEKILDASGYKFHVLTIGEHKYWIGKELVHAFGFETQQGSMNMFNKTMDRKDVHTIRLTKTNGLKELKEILLDELRVLNTRTSHWTEISEIGVKRIPFLSLVREDTLQKYLTLYTRNPDAKEVGKKLYEYFTQPKTLVEVFEKPKSPLYDLVKTEAERLALSKEFLSWYWNLIDGIYWFEQIAYKSTLPRGVTCLMGNYSTLESRFLKIGGKNSAKNVLKRQGASSQMISSNRKIARVFNPPSSDQMIYLTGEFMRTVDLAIEDAIKEGSMSREEAIITALGNPKKVYENYIFVDEDNINITRSIYSLHKKGYADDNEKEFKENHLTNKDKQLLNEGVLFIDMKKDFGQNLLTKKNNKLIGKLKVEKK